MAKNVSIAEDGINKVVENVAKIRTSLVGGGTCDWIPKDDVPLETLEVSEDGVYRPGEHYYGFDKVIASGIGTVTMGDLIEKTITKNGTYNITDEVGSPYGYSKIIVNVDTSDDSGGDSGSGGGNTPVVGKDEDGNDTMAETDDDGNIVMTALPTEIKVIIPPTKLEYNRYEEIDYSGISVYAYISKAIHWLGTTATAATEGSSDNTVSIGDSNVTASVGDGILYAPDRTGQNDIQLVWDGTKWVKPSNYSAEKAVWKSDKYPTGKIPFEELLFPIKRVNETKEDKTLKEYAPSSIRLDDGMFTDDGLDYITIYDGGITFSQNVNDNTGCTIRVNHTLIGNAKFAVFGNDKTDASIWCVSRRPCNIYSHITFLADAPNVRTIENKTFDLKLLYPDYEDIENQNALVWTSTNASAGSILVFSYFKAESGNMIYSLSGSGDYLRASLLNYVPSLYSRFSGTFYYNNVLEKYEASYYDPPTWKNTNIERKNDFNYEKINNITMTSEIARQMFTGEEFEDVHETVPIDFLVQWKRPGDGKILETTFTAWMKDAGSETPQGGDD